MALVCKIEGLLRMQRNRPRMRQTAGHSSIKTPHEEEKELGKRKKENAKHHCKNRKKRKPPRYATEEKGLMARELDKKEKKSTSWQTMTFIRKT